MAFGTRIIDNWRLPQAVVSILVFLEWPLGRPTGWYGFLCTASGFNPCFSGMAFGTFVIAFSFTAIILWFQSLFFWNGLWDQPIIMNGASTVTSFNPCFSGMAFGTDAPRKLE